MSEKKSKERVDVLVVKQGLAESREKAQALILAGQILSGDHLYKKAGEKIDESTVLRVRGETDKYVSRGAYKLLGAVEKFSLVLSEKICLDVGASTGGFTQVCLEAGAKKVYAIDVGHNQMNWKIRNDQRVVCMEGVNMRTAEASLIREKVDFICIDASFISLRLILPSCLQFMKSGAEIVALIKPQHEVGPENVGKGGIVKDDQAREKARDDISIFAQSIGLKVLGLIDSPIKGTTGNIEYLIHLKLV